VEFASTLSMHSKPRVDEPLEPLEEVVALIATIMGWYPPTTVLHRFAGQNAAKC